jgi:hypothetical protein
MEPIEELNLSPEIDPASYNKSATSPNDTIKAQMYNQRIQHYYPIIEPPIFDGSNDASLWLTEYELIAKANHWNDELKLERLIGALAKTPKQYFINAVKYNSQLTWDEFKMGLKLRFANIEQISSSNAHMNGLQDRDSQSFNDYWVSKQQITENKQLDSPSIGRNNAQNSLIHPQDHIAAIEESIIQIYSVVGELKNKVEQILEITKSLHQHNKSRSKRTEEYCHPIKDTYTSINQSIICYRCQNPGHFALRCPSKRK